MILKGFKSERERIKVKGINYLILIFTGNWDVK